MTSCYYRAIATHGPVPSIPDRYLTTQTGLGPVRWWIEQSFALLHRFRRLTMRDERTTMMQLTLLTLAAA